MSNDTDITFQYPPELFNLLVDTIPRLNRGKKAVILFFKGAGVPSSMYDDLNQKLQTAANEINKYDIARTILERLNARGEPALRERREVLRRVSEFTNFDSCWPNDQLEAKGLVAAVRDVINQKDAFTRINQERQQERDLRVAEVQKANAVKQQRAARIEAAKRDFYALFGADVTPQTRGKLLETALNNIFKAYDILVKEAFHLVGTNGEGIVEQVDGVIELKGALYFVEMKWLKDPVGKGPVAEHIVRLMGRAEGRGIFISASDYTDPAVSQARDALAYKLLVLSHLQEIVHLLEKQEELTDFLWKKVQAAQVHKNPYFKPFEAISA